MLLSDYLKLRSQQVSVVTGNREAVATEKETLPKNEAGQTFEEVLSRKLESKAGVDFSNHALRRLESRQIDLAGSRLERLNRGVELAAEKGSSDALVLVDETAFVVSVKNNRVITTMSNEDLKGNIFTNIDSTVII